MKSNSAEPIKILKRKFIASAILFVAIYSAERLSCMCKDVMYNCFHCSITCNWTFGDNIKVLQENNLWYIYILEYFKRNKRIEVDEVKLIQKDVLEMFLSGEIKIQNIICSKLTFYIKMYIYLHVHSKRPRITHA